MSKKKKTTSILDLLSQSANEKETLAGYIHLREEKLNVLQADVGKAQEDKYSNDEMSVFTLRLPKALNDRFEDACKTMTSTKSKTLRSLVEFFILEVEEKMQNDPFSDLIKKSSTEQMEALSSMTQEDQLTFLSRKKRHEDNLLKEKVINQTV